MSSAYFMPASFWGMTIILETNGRHQGGQSGRKAFRCSAVIRTNLSCMTMLSFRVPDEDAAEVQRWADALGIDRSEILRDALHRHLVVLNGEADGRRWEEQ